MTVSSRLGGTVDWMTWSWVAKSMAAMPAKTPWIAKTVTTERLDRGCRRPAPPRDCRRWHRCVRPKRRMPHPERGQYGEDHHEIDRRGNPEEPELGDEKPGGRLVIQAPPVTLMSPPFRIESMPSVTTIEGMRSIGDQRADEGVDRHAEDQRRQPGDPDRIAIDRERAGDGGEHADQRADRDVDMAGDDHHRHADGGDRDIGIAGEDAVEVGSAEEARVDQRRPRRRAARSPPASPAPGRRIR